MARNALIQLRRDTAANWTSTNPTLASGEQGFETDTGKFKIGTGSTAWTSLLYATDGSEITGTTLASNVTGSSLTSVGTLGSLTIDGPTSPSVFFGDWNQDNNWSGIRGTHGYLLSGSNGAGNTGIYLRTESNTHPVNIGANNTNTLVVTNNSATVAGTMTASDFAISTKSVSRGTLGAQTSTTTPVTITTEATQLSFSITAITGRTYRITYFEPQIASPATSGAFLVASIKTGTTKLSGSILQNDTSASSMNSSTFVTWTGTLTAGTQTISATLTSGSGSWAVARSATTPNILTVEDLGT